MKLVKGSIVAEFSGLLIVYVFLALAIYKYETSLGFSVLLFFLSTIIYLLSFLERHYYFEYDDSEIVVRNSWLIIYRRVYEVNEISKIEIVISGFMGIALKIYFKEGKKKIFPINVSRDILEKMVVELSKNLSSS